MNRCLAAVSMSALSVGMLVAGCQKPADQQSGPDAKSSPSMAEAAKTAVKKVIEPKPLVIPADTVIAVVLDQSISSKTSKSGDKFTATVESPVEVEGKVAIPKGARAEGVAEDDREQAPGLVEAVARPAQELNDRPAMVRVARRAVPNRAAVSFVLMLISARCALRSQICRRCGLGLR